MNPATYRRETGRKANWKSNRKWFGPFGVRLSPGRLLAVREHGKKAGRAEPLWIIFLPSIPHARAAGAPTGRSIFLSSQFLSQESALREGKSSRFRGNGGERPFWGFIGSGATKNQKSVLIEGLLNVLETKKGAGASPLLHN